MSSKSHLAKLIANSPSRLDKFFSSTLHLPKSTLYSLIRGGKVFINGQRVKQVHFNVDSNDVISIPFSALARSKIDFGTEFPSLLASPEEVQQAKTATEIRGLLSRGHRDADMDSAHTMMHVIDLCSYQLDHENGRVLNLRHAPSGAEPTNDPSIHPFHKHILFEDAHILIINKPYGMLSMRRDAAHQDMSSQNVVDEVRRYLAHCHNTSPRMVECHLIHRLDRDTTGLLCVAKSVHAARMMHHSLQSRSIRKCYWSVLTSKVEPTSGRIRMPISRQNVQYSTSRGETFSREQMVLDEAHGKPSLTEYQVVKHTSHVASWLNMYPITGRTHQLRVHASLGLHAPILGDYKYGAAYHQNSLGEFLTSNESEDDSGVKMHLHARALLIPYYINVSNNSDSPVVHQHVCPMSDVLEASSKNFPVIQGSAILNDQISKRTYRQQDSTAFVALPPARSKSTPHAELMRAHLCIRAPLPPHMQYTFEQMGFSDSLMEADKLWISEFTRVLERQHINRQKEDQV